ncbi:MAG TPA: STAS domain-containing protein [Candidatus Acidoferrales bacterium]|nr:STAS domain-containing protein [Candidatus Acidoferrales bacterium]
MTDQATFQLEAVDEVPLVVVSGEIDVANVAQFKAFVQGAAAKTTGPLVVSLDGISYMDSHMLEALVDVAKRLRTNRRRLLVTAPRQSAAGHILRLTGIELAIEVFESNEEAVQSLS